MKEQKISRLFVFLAFGLLCSSCGGESADPVVEDTASVVVEDANNVGTDDKISNDQSEPPEDFVSTVDQTNSVELPIIEITMLPAEHGKLATVFSKYVSVFGVNIFATSDTPDAKVLHAAHVMAQYLDNNEDGVVDDVAVLDALVSANASLVMTRTENDFEAINPEEFFGLEYEASQLLFGEETRPDGSGSEGFDATLEEVLHLVTALGYANAHPGAFGESSGSTIAGCMDLARGGKFMSIPNPYPTGSWYHYDDFTCDYRCMVTEYYYWALTSLLGAQDYPGRPESIANEWELPTPALVESGDPCIYALLTNPDFKVPSVLPDGSYGSN
jgi:hypothetical protein